MLIQQFLSKRWLLLALAATMMVVLVACDSEDDDPESPTSTSTATTTTTSTATASASATEAGDDACPVDGAATELTGAGATFPEVLYSSWFAEYADLCGVEVNYQGIGSGGGIEQITSRTVDFGASDGIMSDEQRARVTDGTLLHIPMTSDAVAVIYNLDGVDQLTLDADTLSGIFLGEITNWSDETIAALNPDVELPDQDITVVHRSDGSGTTFIFTNYLAKVSQTWSDNVGNATSVEWPVGLGGEGSSGVAGQVQQLPGSIGYVSLAHANENGIPYAVMVNRSGNPIEASIESAEQASAGVELPDNMEVMLTDSENPEAYPITGFTWLLVYEEQDDEAKAKTLGAMIEWMVTDAQAMVADLHYVPLSPDASAKALAQLESVTYEGTPITELQ